MRQIRFFMILAIISLFFLVLAWSMGMEGQIGITLGSSFACFLGNATLLFPYVEMIDLVLSAMEGREIIPFGEGGSSSKHPLPDLNLPPLEDAPALDEERERLRREDDIMNSPEYKKTELQITRLKNLIQAIRQQGENIARGLRMRGTRQLGPPPHIEYFLLPENPE